MKRSMASSPAGTGAVLLALICLLSACAPLQPTRLPAEQAVAPVGAPVWRGLDELGDGDRHLLLNDGMSALDWRLRAIDSAVEAIDLQTFLWYPDAVGAAVEEHLLRAADRGVRVRILVDDTFLLGQDAVLRYLDDHPNVEYRVYNPHRVRSDDMALREALNIIDLDRLDHRMHNKAMIVDNRIAIVGGRNLADEYFGLDEGANFRDLELLSAGPVVPVLSAAFDRYWNAPWSVPLRKLSQAAPEAPDFSAAAGAGAQIHGEVAPGALADLWAAAFREALPGAARVLVDEPPQDNPALAEEAPVQVAEDLVALFDDAEREIVILAAYLIPTSDLEGAVERAIDRGVSVRILTNSLASNNHTAAHAAYRNHIRRLLDHGARLHEVRTNAEDRALYMAQPVSDKQLALHAKALLIDDDRVFIGSANLDPRSLRINTELGLLVHGETLNQQLRRAFAPDFRETNAWTLELDEQDRMNWVSGDTVLYVQPEASFMQRLEDWFLSQMPVEHEL
jgi:putative cardiolipin synthase